MRHKPPAVQSPGFPGNLLGPKANYWQMGKPGAGLRERPESERCRWPTMYSGHLRNPALIAVLTPVPAHL